MVDNPRRILLREYAQQLTDMGEKVRQLWIEEEAAFGCRPEPSKRTQGGALSEAAQHQLEVACDRIEEARYAIDSILTAET